jgi:hypothetical protein
MNGACLADGTGRRAEEECTQDRAPNQIIAEPTWTTRRAISHQSITMRRVAAVPTRML